MFRRTFIRIIHFPYSPNRGTIIFISLCLVVRSNGQVTSDTDLTGPRERQRCKGKSIIAYFTVSHSHTTHNHLHAVRSEAVTTCESRGTKSATPVVVFPGVTPCESLGWLSCFVSPYPSHYSPFVDLIILTICISPCSVPWDRRRPCPVTTFILFIKNLIILQY